MSSIELYNHEGHRNVLLPDQDAGRGVQSNQHLIVHGKCAILLDPGGAKLYTKVLSAVGKETPGVRLTHLFLSHQDPDIVASLNGWLMTSSATAYCSDLWRRFIPHFGSDRLVYDRVEPIPDEGMILDVGGAPLVVIPGHFLHSVGNFHMYDPASKIMYTGDLGASVGLDYREVTDFDDHVQYMEGFHRRYMSSTKALKAWVVMARQMDIETIAPQHGALFRGPEMVARFLDWCDTLECGIDHMPDCFKVPSYN